MQSAVRLIYPPQCLTCDDFVDGDGSLCGKCWRDTRFITGLCCDKCGVPLPGDIEDESEALFCDGCLKTPRPWARGRAAVLYKDNGRNLVLALKHADRQDLAKPAAKWMAIRAAELVQYDTVMVPIPLHWTRLLKRRYNQSALLTHQLSRILGTDHCPDALVRRKRTQSLEGLGAVARYETLADAIAPHPKRGSNLAGKHVMLVDDVFTSGATLAQATKACLQSQAREVSVIALARVAPDA